MNREAGTLFDVALERGGFQLDVRIDSTATSLVLFGASGSGKSTLLRVLLGLERAARSRIRLDGVWLDDSTRGLRIPIHERRLGWVPQSPTLFPDRSVLDNIRFGARSETAQHDIDRAVEVLELGRHLGARPSELSGGEQQRVALARAIASRPRALVLDEPLASLDLSLRARVLPYLLRVREELRLPLVHVTHDPDEAILLGDEIVILDSGALVAQGEPRQTLWSRAVLPLAIQLGVENLIEVEGATGNDGSPRVRSLAGLELETPWPVSRGEQLRLGVRAEDILIGLDRPGRLSARNVWPGQIDSVENAGDDCLVHVDVGDERLVAKLTERAVDDLGLVRGQSVYLVVKSQALRRI